MERVYYSLSQVWGPYENGRQSAPSHRRGRPAPPHIIVEWPPRSTRDSEMTESPRSVPPLLRSQSLTTPAPFHRGRACFDLLWLRVIAQTSRRFLENVLTVLKCRVLPFLCYPRKLCG